MALNHNTPTFKCISWEGLLVTYNKKIYQVYNSDTNMKYVYWDVDNPNTLQCFNKTQEIRHGLYQIFMNDEGIATERSYEDIKLCWDGNNPDLIASEIYGLHETNKEHGTKFLAIEKNIDGIQTIVGSSSEDKGSILEKVSKLEQRDNEIDMSVSEVKKKFTNVEDRDKLNKSMIEFNSSLGIFKSDINGFFRDKKINQEEKLKIDAHLDILDKKKDEVLNKINVIQSQIEDIQDKNAIDSEKTKFINSVKNLKTYINTAISDNIIVPSEVIAVTDLFAKSNLAINTLKNTLDEIIILGLGGSISEELARINMKSDEISINVSETQDENNKKFSEIKVTTDGISSTVSKKVGEDEIISSINQSAEGIKIDADKVDITGVVTFRDLENEGESVIHGGNIKSNTILAEDIKGGTLAAMDKILFGEDSSISRMNDGMGSDGGMKISTPVMKIESVNLYSFGRNVFGRLECSRAEVSNELHVEKDMYYTPAGDTVSGFTARNGNAQVPKDIWARHFCSYITGGCIMGHSYARSLRRTPNTVENPFDVINSFNVVSENNALRLKTKDVENEYTSHMNPCLSKSEMGTYLDLESMVANLVNATKELKSENEYLKQRLDNLENK